MKPILAIAALGTALALITPGLARSSGADAGRKLVASLSGRVEVPPGDLDGVGRFVARVNPGQGRLCYTLTSARIGTRTMAHIHEGAAGVAGPPVVTLLPDSPRETCMAVDKALAEKLIRNPRGYYVNVHTTDHPQGAIRGQLTK